MSNRLIPPGTKVYISSYMTRHKDLNIPAFYAKQKELEAKGLRVLNPADIPLRYGANKPYNFYLKKAMQLMLDADVMLVFGDERAIAASIGVNKELSLASLVGIPVFEQELPGGVIKGLKDEQV